ncbi:Crp/Fnr family transcriptional regulator [Halotia branconii]|uniref:Crp/Fnr family transcriptional regulator n=1 Tax=Halotia branconii CENA392 TaxID=1539056 RepID=A0AAJ6PBZ2_9CYAN|nr:Crp/Fnr family transcriptional regulator [Halotia branconii]WGV28439.1 Crp/Fnr family transcriptional regulator [Halotia branconii CENA392]
MYEPFYEFIRQFLPEFKIDVTIVEPLLESRKVYKGEFLFREGDVCDFVGLTLKGCLRTFFLKDAKEFTLFFHSEHQPLGDYESFSKQRPACFSCQAIEDSEVLLINHQVLQVFEVAPDGQKFLRLYAESLAFMLRDKLLSLFKDTPEQRYLNLIQTEPLILQRIPQYYLASYLGIEPESLSRLKRRVHH